MQISELFDAIKDCRDRHSYSGAISTVPVVIETEDSDTLYDKLEVTYNEMLNRYIIKATVQ